MNSIAKEVSAKTRKLMAWSPEAPIFGDMFQGSRKFRNAKGTTYHFRDGSKGYVPKGSPKMEALPSRWDE